MENRRVTRGKRVKYDRLDHGADESDESRGTSNVAELDDDIRKSRIRDTNKEFNKRMTILQTWSEYWSDYTTREGDAYSKAEAKSIIKKSKKIGCPIPSCRRVFTTIGGLRYHYARCNIEKCFKCKVCNPPSELKTRGDLLRHMVRLHHERLPDLNSEQKEIANSFLTSSGRTERSKGRKSSGDSESHISAKAYVKSFNNLLIGARCLDDYGKRPFSEWQTLCRDWELLTSDLDIRRFQPPERESVRFKSSNENTWNTIRVGESVSSSKIDGSPPSMIFFTGGINTAAAWLPKPPENVRDKCKEHVAIAVNSCSMDRSVTYKDSKDINGCLQFWSTEMNLTQQTLERRPSLDFMVGHNYGVISEMHWCPLGVSWEAPDDIRASHSLARLGLLALACGDGQIRILSVPHFEHLQRSYLGNRRQSDHLDTIPMFRVKPIAALMPPGVGISTDYQQVVCTSLFWNVDDNQRLIAAGYSNGIVALFDLANYSPILHSNPEHRYVYQPYKIWTAHCLPVVSVGILSNNIERTLIATGSRDRHLKIWNPSDLSSCITFDRAPVTRLIWDYRLRGIVAASEAAFTSFHNRVSYRFPAIDGSAGMTVSTHRATVWGLANSLVTSSLATSDEAGEVFIAPAGRPASKRTKSYFDTFSLYTLLPRPNEKRENVAPEDFDHSMIISNDGLTTTSLLVLDKNEQIIENIDPNNEALDGPFEEIHVEDDYTFAERPIANKPAKFLLPIDVRAIETYSDFKQNFGLEFVDYDSNFQRRDQKLPEAWTRPGNTANIYCDRVCDYPFSSIKHLSWSPNLNSYSTLLSVAHIGLCRFDRIPVVEQIYKGHIDHLSETIGQK